MASSGVETVSIKIAGTTIQLEKDTNDPTGKTWIKSFTAPSIASGVNSTIYTQVGSTTTLNPTGKGGTPELIQMMRESQSAYNALDIDNNGKYRVEVTAVDYAGNPAKANSSLGVTSKNKPVVAIRSPSSTTTVTSKNVQVEFVATSFSPGIDTTKLMVKLDSGEWVTATLDRETRENSGIRYSSTKEAYATYTFQNVQGKSHTLYAKACSLDGVWSEVESSTFTLDAEPPTINISNIWPARELNGVFITNSDFIGVTGTAVDTPTPSEPPSAYYKIGVDGNRVSIPVTPYTDGRNGGYFNNHTIDIEDLADGEYDIYFWAEDKVGNTTEELVRKRILVDRKPPVIESITFNPDPTGTSEEVTITVVLSDA